MKGQQSGEGRPENSESEVIRKSCLGVLQGVVWIFELMVLVLWTIAVLLFTLFPEVDTSLYF